MNKQESKEIFVVVIRTGPNTIKKNFFVFSTLEAAGNLAEDLQKIRARVENENVEVIKKTLLIV